jgi:flagellar biosynthetic protein FliP
MLVVSPIVSQIHANAWVPMEQGTFTQEQAIEEAGKSLKTFLMKYAREKDIKLFLEISHAPAPHTADDLELKVLIPAYIISELKTGFQIGAVLFLPFLVIDIVVASVTVSVGMMQLPPVMLSAPFKILLFVLVDGWNLLIGSLIKSFY